MIDFGDWLNANKYSLDVDVVGLFEDSYKCFKNDIDRPSYLLAYQGMMQHIRLTVLQSASKPTGFANAEWEHNWLEVLRNDDKWDEKTFQCTQQKEDPATGKAAVMNIKKEVREKFIFWRQLRNVCAHYKGYDLHKAHTIALYSFIEQYLMTMSVEGSQVSLNRQFDDFFNPVVTSVHADIKPLLSQIDSIIQDDEFETFFIEVRKSCGKHASFTSRFHDFVHEVICNCPRRVKDALVKYIQSDDNYRDDYLEKYPEDVLTILTGADNIHNFWYTRLPHSMKKLIMLALMLESDYIPDADKKDAMMRCLRNAEDYTSGTDYSGVNDEYVKVLSEKGFFDLFYDRYFNANNTSHNSRAICYKTDFYMGMISMIKWDEKYVERLIEVFNEQYVPYTLRDRLQEKYRQDGEYKATIDRICSDKGLTLPSNIV